MVLPIVNPTKSYWIEAADSPLRDFRSSTDLPLETDVVIVGSGYTGASAAYWLHKYTQSEKSQPRLLMLEARDVCGGATGRNGGQLRPHAYSRYPIWAERFGASGALSLIQHEMAHLPAFAALLAAEGIVEETCFALGDTFDAAMSDVAWARLKGAFEAMQRDHGVDGDVIRECRLIEDRAEAEEYTQMKGCVGAVVHPAGQIWAYKFVHALLRIVLGNGNLNLQANTPATYVSAKDEAGYITVTTPRGAVRTRAVIHASNAWASHLLPAFEPLIFPGRGTLAAITAPTGFVKHTGAQHWDAVVNNYHLQLPPPYNAIIIGGAKAVLARDPHGYMRNDREDKQFAGVPEYFAQWPAASVEEWPGSDPAELGLPVEEGGCWSGVFSASIDDFPFVGPVPSNDGHFIAAGFTGHGMPRILLSTAHLAPLVLTALRVAHTAPELAADFPPLPQAFVATKERVARLGFVDTAAKLEADVALVLESARGNVGWNQEQVTEQARL